ncbi:MAG: metallophosphoesterase [Acutalibacteraceae bacterium]
MFQKDFKPILRFMVVSDVHYKDEECIEEERMASAIKTAYKLSEESDSYKKLDALYVVGDFANSGTETQMLKFKKTLDENIKPETQYAITMASHEYHGGGVEAAHEKFQRIFNLPVDEHRVINGFHFISLTCSKGTNFNEEKISYAARELKKAREDDPKKPIFVFQHPHITDTVYGSKLWGEDELYSTFTDFPQMINFSGHSHAPINDPRSIHQKHFTSLGTGSLSYTELDEFDKYCGTLPPKRSDFAQFLIVEADRDGRVRVYPYDVFSGNFFPYIWEIDEPWNPDSFKYTDEIRYKNPATPYFTEDDKIDVQNVAKTGFTVRFPQAKIDEDYVNDYKIVITQKDTGIIVKQTVMWSEYYFCNMPDFLEYTFTDLKPETDYEIKIFANSFWKTTSEPIFAEAKTL